MKISYSILTHNEDESLQRLLEFLVKHKDEEDEIVILDDYSDNPTKTFVKRLRWTKEFFKKYVRR